VTFKLQDLGKNMQKKLIVLAVTSIMAAPMVAQAGLEVYGKGIVSVEASDNGATNGDAMTLSTNQSRIGFKGAEELDGGLTFIWQWENYVNFDTGGWGGMDVDNGAAGADDNSLSIKGRNTYVGFRGDFGKALAGRHDTPYKQAVTDLDPFKDLAADFNSIMGVSEKKFKHADRLSNMLAYTSPEVGGFQFLGAYILDETRDNVNDDGYSFAGVYKNGPLRLSAGYQVANEQGNVDASSNLGNDTAMELGVSYAIGKTDLSFIYETTDSDTKGVGEDTDRNAMFFAVKHKIDKNTLALTYTVVDDYGTSVDTGASQVSAGVYRALSKKTKLYALYTAIDNDAKAKFDLYNETGGVEKGYDPSSLTVGVISKFSSM